MKEGALCSQEFSEKENLTRMFEMFGSFLPWQNLSETASPGRGVCDLHHTTEAK